uniref:Uncharacterized protein n=1 Tax=Oryza punctata TaxID=4537 RepID=A0A0E0KSI3_ORYPU
MGDHGEVVDVVVCEMENQVVSPALEMHVVMDLEGTTKKTPPMQTPRARLLHSCGESILAMARGAYQRVEAMRCPVGCVARGVSRAAAPVLSPLRLTCLSALAFADRQLLVVQDVAAVLFPATERVLGRADDLVLLVESLPARLDGAIDVLEALVAGVVKTGAAGLFVLPKRRRRYRADEDDGGAVFRDIWCDEKEGASLHRAMEEKVRKNLESLEVVTANDGGGGNTVHGGKAPVDGTPAERGDVSAGEECGVEDVQGVGTPAAEITDAMKDSTEIVKDEDQEGGGSEREEEETVAMAGAESREEALLGLFDTAWQQKLASSTSSYDLEGTTKKTPPMQTPRARLLHSCGESILAMARGAYQRVEAMRCPVGCVARGVSRAAAPVLSPLRLTCLSALAFADRQLLVVQDVAAVLFPATERVLGRADDLVLLVESLPARLDGAIDVLEALVAGVVKTGAAGLFVLPKRRRRYRADEDDGGAVFRDIWCDEKEGASLHRAMEEKVRKNLESLEVVTANDGGGGNTVHGGKAPVDGTPAERGDVSAGEECGVEDVQGVGTPAAEITDAMKDSTEIVKDEDQEGGGSEREEEETVAMAGAESREEALLGLFDTAWQQKLA